MAMDAKRILVVGGAGGVGRLICDEVIRQLGKGSLVVGDYKPARGQALADRLGEDFRFVDVNNIDGTEINDVNAVIVATPQSEPYIQSVCIERRIPCFDITLSAEFAAKVGTLEGRAQSTGTPVVVMAGLIPGLSGVIVKQALKDFENIDEINLGLLENTQTSSPGTVGTADWLGMLAKPVEYKGQRRNGFSVTRKFIYPESFGERTLRLFDYPESEIIRRKSKAREVYYWTAFDKESFNRVLVLLKWLRVLDLFNVPRMRLKAARIGSGLTRMLKQSDTPVALAVEVSGTKHGKREVTQLGIVGPSDYGTTAMVTVAMVKLLLDGDVQATGVRYPMDIFALPALTTAVDSPKIKLFASTNEV